MNFKEKSEKYLSMLLNERYNDDVGRTKEKCFDGADIKNAYMGGAQDAMRKVINMVAKISIDDLNRYIGEE